MGLARALGMDERLELLWQTRPGELATEREAVILAAVGELVGER